VISIYNLKEHPPMPVPPYGTAINQALKNPRTKVQNLKALRDRANALLTAQGDLKGALRKLDREIKARERTKTSAKKK
jgi:uncharacterized protein DUF1843